MAELLVVLLILGQISAFSIPKVLNAQANHQKKAIAKEIVSTFSSALETMRLNGSLTSATKTPDLLSYVNYIATTTAGDVDYTPADFILYGAGTYTCDGTWGTCVKLHNGATILAFKTPFGGTATNRFIWLLVDPDGRTTNQYDSILFILYYNGRISTWQNMEPNSQNNVMTWNPGANYDPTWFSW